MARNGARWISARAAISRHPPWFIGAVLAGALGACGGSGPAPRTGPPAAGSTALVVGSDLAAEAEALRAGDETIRVHVAGEAAPDDEQSGPARRMVDEAHRHYVAIEFDEALATIREAVVLLESEARTREDFDLLADAFLIRGMAELGLGRDEAAGASFLAAARLRPDRALDEGRYPPQVRERYEALRAELRAEPAGSITVTTRPAGATLFLDGKERGIAPETLYGTSGRHQLRVVAPGHAERTLAVVLSPEGEQLSIELPELDAPAAAARVWHDDGALDDEAAREAIAGSLGASRLAIARRSAGGVTVSVIDLSSGERGTSQGASLEEAYAGAPSAPAEASLSASARRHDGFYTRVSLGAALRGDSHVLADDQRAEGGSAAIDFELAVGGSLAPGIVLGGSLLVLAGGAELEFDARGATRLAFVSGLAACFTWYPKATDGWHVDALLGLATGRRSDGGDLEATGLFGGVLGAGGGYEWWIGPELSLGLAGRVALYGLGTTDEASWSILSLGLAATLTYN